MREREREREGGSILTRKVESLASFTTKPNVALLPRLATTAKKEFVRVLFFVLL